MPDTPVSSRSKYVAWIGSSCLSMRARNLSQEFVRRRPFSGLSPASCKTSSLEKSAGPGEFNFVTIVEWASLAAFENAKETVLDRFKKMNFNPQDLLVRLGIKADLADYTRVDDSVFQGDHHAAS